MHFKSYAMNICVSYNLTAFNKSILLSQNQMQIEIVEQ